MRTSFPCSAGRKSSRSRMPSGVPGGTPSCELSADEAACEVPGISFADQR
jgi:hypothetical protein